MDHAPISPFDSNGRPPAYWQAGVTEIYAAPLGAGDKKVQAYNFRLCVTTNKSNSVPFPKPDNYNRSDWELVFKLGATADGGNLKRFLNNFGPLPNGKFDLNNGGVLSTDCAGCSWGYVTLALMTHPLRGAFFGINSRTLMGCTDPPWR